MSLLSRLVRLFQRLGLRPSAPRPQKVAWLGIADIFEGEGRFAGRFGGFVLEGQVEGLDVRCEAGYPFTEEEHTDFWLEYMKWLGWRGDDDNACPVIDDDDIQHLWIRGLAEVHFTEVTADGSLKDPVLTLRYREDPEDTTAVASPISDGHRPPAAPSPVTLH